MRQNVALLLAFLVISAVADVVHVYEKTSAGGVVTQITDRTLDTGRRYTTSAAPANIGYIFTHWSISTVQSFESRDAWGRAFDSAPFTLYEETTLTANYLPVSQDSDGDGMADGYELYWYGSLAETPASDTDNDGLTFAQEIAAGTNPLFPERHEDGLIAYADSALWLYNPYGYVPYTIRSEPEGALFATVTGYKRVGKRIASADSYTASATSSRFAYWSLNGVRQADAWGRAVDSISLTMPSNAVEIVAVAESDYNTRMSLYWYGAAGVSPSSDTDNDGKTFAEELAAGTNPLFPERHEDGPVTFADGALLQYNPYNLQPYTIRSEPEGALFATTSGYVRAGQRIASGTQGTQTTQGTGFAYWSLNGIEQRDAWGRSVDSISMAMPTSAVGFVAHAESDYNTRRSLYWYGAEGVSPSSDTDNDGKTFAEELAAGTNPLFPERHEEGPVAYADTATHELNLQPYEQAQGAIVGGAYSQIFTSPIAGNAATSMTFGNEGAIWPVVADLNDDGLWDLIVVSASATNVFLNVGGKGNPEFEVCTGGSQLVATAGIDLETNSVAKLALLSLDVAAPADALSATYGDANQDGAEDLLVSDGDGRIWYYKGVADGEPSNSQTFKPSNFSLQHKVWGGSYAGFAQGLRLAAVDWEDDGDLDCLVGTADGKLMLLRDPKVGRPTNLKALAGVDNVLLTWDPNAQSRIRGYRVYRAAGDGTASGQQQDGAFARIGQTPLPTYRDFPAVAGDGDPPEFAYKVSSVSRFYTAGNSTPTETESTPTEAVMAQLGGVKFFWNDAVVRLGDKAEVMLSIENSMNYDVAGKTQTVAFAPAYLTPVRVERSGLAEDVSLSWSCVEGLMTISMTGGTLAAGSGKFLTLVFDTVKAGTTKVGGENGATVSIEDSIVVPYQLGDVDGDGDVDKDDLQLLARLKNGNGQHPTTDQIKAGDFNGNGKLDNADFQALKALLKERGL